MSLVWSSLLSARDFCLLGNMASRNNCDFSVIEFSVGDPY